jgi:predicted transcriptional regulator
MAKQETTLYLDEDVLQATRVLAERTGRPEQAIVDEALRSYLGLDAVAAVWNRSSLTDDDAMRLAYDELHAMRRERSLTE